MIYIYTMDFYIAYNGNKTNEIKNFINYFNIDDYDNIIEPFGGSLAFSRYIYNIDIDKKLNYHISDINEELIYFCNNIYKDKENIIIETLKDINNIENKEDFNLYINNKKNINDKDFLKYYLFLYKYYMIRPGLYKLNKAKPKFKDYNKKTLLSDEFFKNNEYKYLDFKINLEKFKDDERAFLFLDPPYVNSDNSFYRFNECENIWEYLYNYLNSCKCKFILIVNDNTFMKIIFKNFYKGEYNKKYLGTKIYKIKDIKLDEKNKNICNHIIFSNIN